MTREDQVGTCGCAPVGRKVGDAEGEIGQMLPALASSCKQRLRHVDAAYRETGRAIASATAVLPAPQPRSTARPPRTGPAARLAASRYGANPAKLLSMRGHCVNQTSPTAPTQSAAAVTPSYRSFQSSRRSRCVRRHDRTPKRERPAIAGEPSPCRCRRPAHRSSSASGPVIISSATASVRVRIAFSSLSASSGCSRRYVFAFSRPWPIRIES